MILAAVASISSIASNNIQKLRLITQDLYEHPFAVSNASIDLKSSLFQVRNYVLQVAVIRKDIEYAKVTKPKVEALYKTIKADLAVIKGNFLGDMNRVIELETKLAEFVPMHVIYDLYICKKNSGEFIHTHMKVDIQVNSF